MELVYKMEGILFKILPCLLIAMYAIMCLFGSYVQADFDVKYENEIRSLPDIPEDLLNNYKYFFIRCYSSFAILYCSNSNVIKGQSNYLKLYNSEYGKTSWKYSTEGTYNFDDATISALVYANDDLYDTDGNVVFQKARQELATIIRPQVEGIQLQEILQEIIQILPLTIAVVVSFLGLRKALSWLLTRLRQS